MNLPNFEIVIKVPTYDGIPTSRMNMSMLNVLVIVWMVLIGIGSIFLVNFVVSFIKEKPVSSINVVDLIYCDVLLWLLVAVMVYLLGIAACHLSAR